MNLSPTPDFQSDRRLVLAALAVTLFAAIGLVVQYSHLAKTLGDPDDALRLVLVRDLMAGRGWYDQLVTRLQPPLGTVMHWSRLLDGLLAGLIWMFRLVLSPSAAETAVRLLWPLFLIFPGVLCALAMARRPGRIAAAGGAFSSLFILRRAFLAVNQLTFLRNSPPGRVDHHNLQIDAGDGSHGLRQWQGMSYRSRWALLAGAATGFGLAIGIEGLPFHMVVAASYGLLAASGRDDPRTTRSYAGALLGMTLACFYLQTPPTRWTMAFCDAIGINLVTGIAVGGCGLLLMTAAQAPLRTRWIILAATALAVSAAYLSFNPRCIRGVFAAVDPRLRSFWFDSVYELQPLPVMMRQHLGFGIALILMSAMMLASAAFLLARESPRPRPATWLSGAAVLVAVATGFAAFRMENYVQWLGFPVLASAFALIAARFWKGLMVPTAAFAVAFSPVGAVAFVLQGYTSVTGTQGTSKAPQTVELCHDTRDFHHLATLRPGLVLADIYMGPFILANTQDSALTAPYHRMSWGILAAHDALSASSAQAEAKFRALKIDYLAECPASPVTPEPGSIEADLKQGNVPGWLQPLSDKSDALQIYGVRSR